MTHLRAKVFFCLYLCAIAYLSLYPWEFTLYSSADSLVWVPLTGRRQILDAVLNVFFYIPLGAAAFLSLRRGWRGWLMAISIGACLSWAIEWLQLWSVTRYGNLTDLAANSAGAIIGATIGYAAVRGNWFPEGLSQTRAASHWRIPATGSLFLVVWALWQAFPLIPALTLVRLTQVVAFMSPWSWRTFVESMLGFATLRLVLGRSPWLWIAFVAVPAQAFLLDRYLSLSVLSGAALGWAIAQLAGQDVRLRLGLILPAWLLFEELRPFSFTQERHSLSWAPFGSWYGGSASAYYPVIFGKLFLYIAVVWGLRERRVGWLWAVFIPSAILAGGEWAQQFIPGRTPESTDVVLLLGGAVLLGLCEKGRSEDQS